jgi:hypothetical protein
MQIFDNTGCPLSGGRGGGYGPHVREGSFGAFAFNFLTGDRIMSVYMEWYGGANYSPIREWYENLDAAISAFLYRMEAPDFPCVSDPSAILYNGETMPNHADSEYWAATNYPDCHIAVDNRTGEIVVTKYNTTVRVM